MNLARPPLPSRVLLASAVIAGLTPLGGPVQASAAPMPRNAAPAVRVAEPRPAVDGDRHRMTGTVTLVTGDRVTLVDVGEAQPEVRIEPRRGNPTRGFAVSKDEDGVTVIPDDVADLVPDVLDPELFDVTAMLAMGYGDRATGTLPLIVERSAGVRSLAQADDGLDPVRVLPSIHATAVTLDKQLTRGFGRGLGSASTRSAASTSRDLGGISHVWLDGRVKAAELDHYLTQVGAPSAWDLGLTGAGVKVAVLDTGVDAEHPALEGQVDAQANFTDSPLVDGHGHGTHVASLVAGNGALSDDARQGIAPGADLVTGKVLGDDGFGQDSWLIAGMEWATAQNADVVSMSLGAAPVDGDDPLIESLEALAASSGPLFVVAAGNRGGLGRNSFTIESPGAAASALTVGAVSGTDRQAIFSSEGPTRGTYRMKPEILAPGVEILGAEAGARSAPGYVPMSGTSMATPIVAGAAAVLLEQHPGWEWQQVKATLVGTADPTGYPNVWMEGGGRLDLAEATTQDLTADVSSLSWGYLRYPDESVRTTEVTLTNASDSPVDVTWTDEVALDYSGFGDVVPAPDGTVTVTPPDVTVPGDGTATVEVRLDPGVVDDGLWQGTVVAEGGGEEVRIPLGFYDEPERYDITLDVIDRNGNPYANGEVELFDGANGGYRTVYLDAAGHAVVRMPPGEYSMFSRVVTPPGSHPDETFTLAGSAEVPVTGDTAYTIDARDAVRLRAPRLVATPTRVDLGFLTYGRHSDDGRGFIGLAGFTAEEIAAGRIFISPTEPVDHGSFEAAFRWQLTPRRPAPSGVDRYEFLLTEDHFADPLSPTLDGGDLGRMARVDNRFRGLGTPGQHYAGRAWLTDESGVALISYEQVDVPSRRVDLVSADADVYWAQCFTTPEQYVTEMCDGYRSFDEGEQLEQRWGANLHPAVVGGFHSPGTLFLETGLSDGQHEGQLDFAALDSVSLELWRDGQLVQSEPSLFGWFSVPDERATYELRQHWVMDSELLPVSTESTTTWRFTSAPADDPEFEPSPVPAVLALDYDVAVDDLGRADRHGPLPFTLGVRHLEGATEPGNVDRATVSYSVDEGSTWYQVVLKRAGAGSYVGSIPARALRDADALSLRATAGDDLGNAVEQTVIGIVPLR